MKHIDFSFRLAHQILEHRPAWAELRREVEAIEREEVVSEHESMQRKPAGGQSALNRVFEKRLIPLGWQGQPFLFAASDDSARRWKMDFIKDRIGIEVAFNHAEATPWIFTRLNLAGESSRTQESSRVEVGVAFYATERLKKWANMDSAVGTFELACDWLELMRPIMPIPVMVVGLDSEGWDAAYVFRGTRKGGRRGPVESDPGATLL